MPILAYRLPKQGCGPKACPRGACIWTGDPDLTQPPAVSPSLSLGWAPPLHAALRMRHALNAKGRCARRWLQQLT